MVYFNDYNTCVWRVGSYASNVMSLASTGLTVNSTTYSSDRRSNFNDKPLTNALDAINRLELLEYVKVV